MLALLQSFQCVLRDENHSFGTIHLKQVSSLRAILCKNQTKWEMKNFDPHLKFACK